MKDDELCDAVSCTGNDAETVSQGSLKAWLLAARPKTLTGAATPILISMAMAYADLHKVGEGIQAAVDASLVVGDVSSACVGASLACGEVRQFSFIVAALCLLFAFTMQIDANFINDYFDFVKGIDDKETRLGPKRACAQGWITPRQMLVAIVLTTFLACCTGLPLIFFGGMEMILVGLLCVVFCFLYTTSMSYMGLGDILVLVFFGIVPVCVPYFLQTGTLTWQTAVASLACGLAIDALLIVNNYRDRDTDRMAGKRTIVVMIGSRAAERLYLGVGLTAYLIGMVLAFGGFLWAALLPLVYLWLHINTFRKLVRINHGSALNVCLGETARNIFIYGLTLSLALLL